MHIIIIHYVDSGRSRQLRGLHAHKNSILYDGGHLPLFSYLVTSYYILTYARYSKTYIILYTDLVHTPSPGYKNKIPSNRSSDRVLYYVIYCSRYCSGADDMAFFTVTF